MPSNDPPPDATDADRDDPTGEIDVGTPPLEPLEAITDAMTGRGSSGLPQVLALGVLGIAVLIVLIVNPGNVIGLEEMAAFVLAIAGFIELVGVIRVRGPIQRYLAPGLAIGAGAVIWIWPAETRVVVGLVVGAVLIARGAIDIWSGVRRWHERGANVWTAVRGLILIAIGILVLLIPDAAVPTAVVGGALLLIGRAVIAIGYTVTAPDDAPAELKAADTYSVIAYWLSKREMHPDDIHHIEDAVFLNRGNTRDRVWRFGALMFLSTAIATFGIAADSTAVVIGAMLVAPLMTPILGVSAGLIHGRTRSTLFSTAVVAGGAVGSVGLAWLLSSLIPDLAVVVNNAQVVSRTAPNLIDLAIAVAAGAAGAYGVSRAERSDALPGVAVAIALVPPLAVIGITLHAGELHQAAGATLLFLTNLFTIILMAGLVFIVVGYTSWSRLHYRRNRIRTAFAVVLLGVVVITIPLALTARSIVGTSTDIRNATAAVDQWLTQAFPEDDPRPVRVNDLAVDGDVVVVQLIGWEQPPDTNQLTRMLTRTMGRTVTSSVRWIEEHLTGVTPPVVDGES